MNDETPKFIIYSPPYTEQYGGVMALHTLAETLQQEGFTASIWHWDRPTKAADWLPFLMKKASSAVAAVRRRRARLHRRADTIPRARLEDVSSSIVVYPEIVDGNPLGAQRVVRWFLNKPGKLTGKIEYGTGELYFYYMKVFDDPAINPDGDNLLSVVSVLDEVYQQRNFGPRSGTCYILRKGLHRAPDPSSLDGEVIDALSHEQIADLFNKREFCVSYDTQTLYCFYAAMCGCRVVVIPEEGTTADEWLAGDERPLGVAYGFEDLPRADATRPLVRQQLLEWQAENGRQVRRFVDRCRQFFGTVP